MAEENKEKIILELTEMEKFKLDMVVKAGLSWFEDVGLNKIITDSSLKNIDNEYIRFGAKILTMINGGIDEKTRYEIQKMFFEAKLITKIKNERGF